MGSTIDTANYVSALNTAAPLLTKETKLSKNQNKKLEETSKRKPKSFLNTILDSAQKDSLETDYEARLKGLSSGERKAAIDDILADLQDKVYSSGSNLADNINTDTISEYKKAVKTFVNFAVKHSLDVKSIISGGLNPIKQRNYTIVKIIDEKVERLTKELLFNQLEKLQILEKLDEIKGLLINLTM
ncbi:YaaR family protein [Treponema pedis]|uniref:YaaR family protein n=1 Tax=Treponema pedis TaxID=409322 RepID=A0A7S6WPC6_9SPIR|nr:YaaR family protein [Treponema pedis]QOW60836.1 YaaR family protein [Treponema pedis]QSI04117.1 DUF327 family protein [Treponema pedis]